MLALALNVYYTKVVATILPISTKSAPVENPEIKTAYLTDEKVNMQILNYVKVIQLEGTRGKHDPKFC